MAEKIKSRLGKLGGKIAVKIKRPWRGYSVGAIINPPATLRQMLVSAEIADEVTEEVEELTDGEQAPRKRGRPKKTDF